MEVEIPGRLMVVVRDRDNRIIDCFPGPLAHKKVEALTIAYTLLNAGRARLERVEIHPYEHAASHYVKKPLAVVTREDLVVGRQP